MKRSMAKMESDSTKSSAPSINKGLPYQPKVGDTLAAANAIVKITAM